jgi:hypothetical protein
MTDKEQSDFDSPWKDMLDSYFEEFITFFFPQAYTDNAIARRFEYSILAGSSTIRGGKENAIYFNF